MDEVVFDSYQFVNALKTEGMPEGQARILSKQYQELLVEKLATKRDLHLIESNLKTDMALLESNLKKDMALLKNEMIKWVLGFIVGQTALLLTVIPYLS